jgi:hypothetical protein
MFNSQCAANTLFAALTKSQMRCSNFLEQHLELLGACAKVVFRSRTGHQGTSKTSMSGGAPALRRGHVSCVLTGTRRVSAGRASGLRGVDNADDCDRAGPARNPHGQSATVGDARSLKGQSKGAGSALGRVPPTPSIQSALYPSAYSCSVGDGGNKGVGGRGEARIGL